MAPNPGLLGPAAPGVRAVPMNADLAEPAFRGLRLAPLARRYRYFAMALSPESQPPAEWVSRLGPRWKTLPSWANPELARWRGGSWPPLLRLSRPSTVPKSRCFSDPCQTDATPPSKLLPKSWKTFLNLPQRLVSGKHAARNIVTEYHRRIQTGPASGRLPAAPPAKRAKSGPDLPEQAVVL